MMRKKKLISKVLLICPKILTKTARIILKVDFLDSKDQLMQESPRNHQLVVLKNQIDLRKLRNPLPYKVDLRRLIKNSAKWKNQ